MAKKGWAKVEKMEAESFTTDISLCSTCNCMTHTTRGHCGKCWSKKNNGGTDESQVGKTDGASPELYRTTDGLNGECQGRNQAPAPSKPMLKQVRAYLYYKDNEPIDIIRLKEDELFFDKDLSYKEVLIIDIRQSPQELEKKILRRLKELLTGKLENKLTVELVAQIVKDVISGK